jgi:hypothetical protein
MRYYSEPIFVILLLDISKFFRFEHDLVKMGNEVS